MEEVPIHYHCGMVSLKRVLVNWLRDAHTVLPLSEIDFSRFPHTCYVIVKDKFRLNELEFFGVYFPKSIVSGVHNPIVGLNKWLFTFIVQEQRLILLHLDTHYILAKVLHLFLPRCTNLTLLRPSFSVA